MTPIQTQITFDGIPHSDALEDVIRGRVAWLAQFYPGLLDCRVRVEVPDRHRHTGRQVRVRIDAAVPGGPPIVVTHEPTLHATLKDEAEPAHHKASGTREAHRDARIAVHEAFDAARRRVQDFARKQRHAVKTHVSRVETEPASPAEDKGGLLHGQP